ncbi:TonB-dependent receptor [Sphingomonas sp.]|uniref:TonB-dependent receptor n=1 Tax=Sphingomonas sp. TaxID=28214 RepID=UPI0025F1D172|nr:TonB-dependent receptor [Sphingomonas sp.]
MLAGTGYRAVPVGPRSFRLEPAPSRTAPDQQNPSPVYADTDSPAEIIVTALKRARPLSTLPATVTVLRGFGLDAPVGLAGTGQIANEVSSLTSSSLGPGRNRLFLRGIGDGPLNGFNQGSVAMLLDEARLTYDAPDPDWALVDIDQIEVLEGPQGPLYGTGALGGIVKISTNRPDPTRATGTVTASLASTRDGDLSNSQSAVLNLPIITSRLAVRAVAYRQEQAGWINNIGGASDANRERLTGARLSLRWHPADHWTVDLMASTQERKAFDSQYVDGNVGPVDRPDRGLEPRDLDNRLAMMTIAGRVGELELTSISSINKQEAVAEYDATPLGPVLGTNGPTMVSDDRTYSLFDQEFRISNGEAGRFDWLAGISYIKAETDADIRAHDASLTQPVLSLRRSITEAAVFGEASFAITPQFTLGGGGRVFASKFDDEGQQGSSGSLRSKQNIRGAGSASLTWTPSNAATFFLRAATAYRPGGINVEPDATQAVHDADELASIELGSHIRLGRDFSADATFFATRWRHVQADELLANGLVATRNAGNARNFGIEANLRWNLTSDSEFSGGVIWQSARLNSASGTIDIDDARLPAVPQLATRVKFAQGFRLGSWESKADVGMRYVGATHLSFDPILDRRTGNYVVVDASITATRGNWSVAIVGDNLTNSSADTFAFGNPYRVRAIPQHTPIKPLTVGVTLGRKF